MSRPLDGVHDRMDSEEASVALLRTVCIMTAMSGSDDQPEYHNWCLKPSILSNAHRFWLPQLQAHKL
jgi:hypothetical protein